MTSLNVSLYSWDNGAFIMIGVFALVIIVLVGVVFLMMNSKNKKND
ncbi:MAG: hypothetical protein KAX93_00990 [Flavobacterium sp.]|nr:hypothetical protein [Flavobacterium sp.]MBP8156930.1 hypothetical protein [Flavobacterium sp.]